MQNIRACSHRLRALPKFEERLAQFHSRMMISVFRPIELNHADNMAVDGSTHLRYSAASGSVRMARY